MQIMEGDLIRTIRDNKDYIAHFHTGGVPGRHEIDDTQEVNWRAVATALADIGLPGLHGARVRADARSADVAARSGHVV